jgi:S1-C subfamily serine protease
VFVPAIISVLSGKIRAMRTKNCACLLALAIAAQFNPQFAKAAEPPTEFAYHISVLNGSTIGSAFMIDPGVVVTNAHVLAGLREGEQVSLLASSGGSVVARIEAVSLQMDLAVLSVSEIHVPIVPKTPKQARRGEQIVAVGIVASSRNPRWRHIVRGLVVSETRSVAPFGRGVIARMALLEKGFSGGPVFDRRGGLVGMVTAVRPAHKSPSGHREAFVISADEIRSEVSRLVSNKTNGH